MSLSRVRCFFDIEIDSVPLGRVIFELFSDSCPKTCENFRALCTGELGYGKTTGKALHYRNVKFHRVIKDFMVQAGDFSAANGTGGESIYGGQFEDENFDMTHDTPFLLSMANRGPDTNGSQFFITTQTASHLDGKHVVFGRVISGQEVVVSVENLPVDNRSRPLQQAVIANCGELIMQSSGKLRTKEKKKKKRKVEEESEQENEKKKKKKKEKKHKHKKDKHSNPDEENHEIAAEKEESGGTIVSSKIVSANAPPSLFRSHPLASVSVINPDEIPEVPKNRFLDRGYQNQGRDNYREQSNRQKSKSNVRFFTRSGRKVKGRGLLRYRTPSRSRSRSKSATPPHWRQAQRRIVTYERYQREAEKNERRKEERERLEEEDDETGGEARMRGRVVVGKSGFVREMEGGDERSGSNRDWRASRHETFFEDKENRSKGFDPRQKLKDKLGMKSFIKGATLNKRDERGEDNLDLDDTALDYEAPSDEEEVEQQNEEQEEEREEESKMVKNGRDRHRERDRPRRDREGRERSGRSRGERETDRDRRDRKGRDRRRDSRERSDRYKSSGRHRERVGGSDSKRRESRGGSH